MERREKVNACKELARRSGQWISFDPDRWGENMLDSMESGLQEFLDQLPELDDLQENQERMKAANKIIRSKKLAEVEKVDELVALGMTEANALACMMPDYCGRIGYADYALRNNLATIKDTEAKIKRHAAMAERARGGDEVHEYKWGKLVVAFGDERYRFIFDGKPAPNVISLMKSNAFKWSPSNSAWQRQITVNAKYAIKNYILPKLEEMEGGAA